MRKNKLINQERKKEKKKKQLPKCWTMIKVGAVFLTGSGSGSVSRACPKHGLVMLVKDSYYIYSALRFHRENCSVTC